MNTIITLLFKVFTLLFAFPVTLVLSGVAVFLNSHGMEFGPLNTVVVFSWIGLFVLWRLSRKA